MMRIKEKIITMLMIVLCCTTAHAQVSEVEAEIHESLKFYKYSSKIIQHSSTLINKCLDTDSVELIHGFTNDAVKQLASAKMHLEYAEEKAMNAEYKASKINFSEAKHKTDGAEHLFYEARQELESVINELSRASAFDELKLIGGHLRSAKEHLHYSINNLKNAARNLNDALEELEECDLKNDTTE